MEYLAHIADDGRVQTVSEHLHGTGELAAGFAAPFGAADEARAAGLLHDIGKYSAAFQQRIRGSAVSVDHSTAGAQEARNRRDLPAALAIAGHHGGIPDCGNLNDAADDTTLQGRLKRKLRHMTNGSVKSLLHLPSLPHGHCRTAPLPHFIRVCCTPVW